mmetsp:Transcript_91650/g.268228  ORF Transcript_91650/g.268228 Transcript_91650/m.268228 type:complete len:312 (-) Transcript_91650:1283-2218(-)
MQRKGVMQGRGLATALEAARVVLNRSGSTLVNPSGRFSKQFLKDAGSLSAKCNAGGLQGCAALAIALKWVRTRLQQHPRERNVAVHGGIGQGSGALPARRLLDDVPPGTHPRRKPRTLHEEAPALRARLLGAVDVSAALQEQLQALHVGIILGGQRVQDRGPKAVHVRGVRAGPQQQAQHGRAAAADGRGVLEGGLAGHLLLLLQVPVIHLLQPNLRAVLPSKASSHHQRVDASRDPRRQSTWVRSRAQEVLDDVGTRIDHRGHQRRYTVKDREHRVALDHGQVHGGGLAFLREQLPHSASVICHHSVVQQ